MLPFLPHTALSLEENPSCKVSVLQWWPGTHPVPAPMPPGLCGCRGAPLQVFRPALPGLAQQAEPSPGDLLATLGCDRDCQGMLVTSDGPAAVWQAKRTGLFVLEGEQAGRPLYRNNATGEFLYYSDSG